MTLLRSSPLRRTRDKSGLLRLKTGAGNPARLKTRLSERADEKARELCYRRGGVEFAGERRIPATGTCVCCGERETAFDAIEWAHSFPRGNRKCRWEVWGAFPIKRTHHQRFTRDPEGWRALLISKWGEDVYQERYRFSKTTFGGSITVAFYRELLSELSDALRVARAAA